MSLMMTPHQPEQQIRLSILNFGLSNQQPTSAVWCFIIIFLSSFLCFELYTFDGELVRTYISMGATCPDIHKHGSKKRQFIPTVDLFFLKKKKKISSDEKVAGYN